MNKLFKLIILIMFCCLFDACDNENYMPKPKGYFRINMPINDYEKYTYKNLYLFEKSKLSTIFYDTLELRKKDWINIEYNDYAGFIHVSYKKIDNNLNEYLEDAHSFVTKHIEKSIGINEIVLKDTVRNMYGIIYEIEGSNAACPIQFYFTDSTKNFIRGALYFNISPNNDSLNPVIEYIKKDIYRISNTIEWIN